MATEARPAFLAITGLLECETQDAAARFTMSVRAAAGEAESPDAVAACSSLASRAFGGEREAWAPLVAAVRRLLAGPPPQGARGRESRRELRAFVNENADLLDG